MKHGVFFCVNQDATKNENLPPPPKTKTERNGERTRKLAIKVTANEHENRNNDRKNEKPPFMTIFKNKIFAPDFAKNELL